MADPSPTAHDPTPLVERAGTGNLGLILFAIALVVGGAWIFSVMNTARQQAQISPLEASGQNVGRIEAGQPPQMPARFGERYDPENELRQQPRPVRLVRMRRNSAPVSTPPIQRSASPPASQLAAIAPEPYQPPANLGRAQFERPTVRPEILPLDVRSPEVPNDSGERVRAQRFNNPSFTVPIGTIMPAVLETALDSTRSGSARAIVQQDVYGFDGTRVLIPRGSRLYGEYQGDLQPGQNRALVTWTRLMRPDGVTIALQSDASDQLGRAGIKGKVDTKFFQRFGGALLQSVLDIGVGVATRKAGDGVIVALPGSTQNVARVDQSQVTPTLRVKHGTSLSVYVARDLDFSDVER